MFEGDLITIPIWITSAIVGWYGIEYYQQLKAWLEEQNQTPAEPPAPYYTPEQEQEQNVIHDPYHYSGGHGGDQW